MEKDFAFIIGINNYKPPEQRGLRPLNGAINDANAMEEWLLNPTGGAIPLGNCFKITSTQEPLVPVQDQIDAVADNLFEKARSLGGGRRLYFYFAGHGLGVMDDSRNTALCLSNWSETRRNTALSSTKYEDAIVRFGLFEEVIFFLDCCRNTKINVRPLHPTFDPIAPGESAGNTKVFIAYATQYQDQSFEIDTNILELEEAGPNVNILNKKDKRGVFTKVLLDALKGAAADTNGIINADNLRDYLTYQTPKEAKIHGYKQKPRIEHSFNANIPLFTIANATAKIICKLQFAVYRDKEITLYTQEGVFMVINPALTRTLSLELSPGMYLLEVKETGEKTAFQIIPNKNKQDVNF